MRTDVLVVLLLALSVPASCTQADSGRPANHTLQSFRSEAELSHFLQRVSERQKRVNIGPAGFAAAFSDMPESEDVTNVQHAGVDEGGIVKVHGDHLVILRRGRLFTVHIGDIGLEPVSTHDAFGPGIDPTGTWYDELLVSGNDVVVIGYSYDRGGTEVGLFGMNGHGQLEHRATYHLRSNDYYSSRNYSSRLIGTKLVLYAPLWVSDEWEGLEAALPALRRWHPGATEDEFRPIVTATRVYRPGRSFAPEPHLALHTVTVCDLARAELTCEATVLLGRDGRVFYVSATAVYVWVTERPSGSRGVKLSGSMLYRIPLNGTAPTALRVAGSPVDQFSFLESEDGYINVLVRDHAFGEQMWDAEVAQGDIQLLRAPLQRFSNGSRAAARSAYRRLPSPVGGGHAFHNRFVGKSLLYGVGSGWGPPDTTGSTVLYAVPWTGGSVAEVPLPHGVDRIEIMGSDAIVIGTEGRDLHFTGIDLAAQPQVAQRYVHKEATQGELRSHGFFYRTDGADSGVLGRRSGEPGDPAPRTSTNVLPPFSSSVTRTHTFASSAIWLRSPRARRTTVVRPRASTGTATRGRCSCVAASSRFSAMRSWRAPCRMGGSARSSASPSPHATPSCRLTDAEPIMQKSW